MATFGTEPLELIVKPIDQPAPGKPAILGLVADHVDPIVQVSSPFGSADATPTIRVSLIETGADAGDQVWLKVDGVAGPAGVITARDLQNGYVDIAAEGLGEGVHLVSAVVVDLAGLAGPRSVVFPLRVDTTAPQVRLEGVVDSGGEALVDGGRTEDHALVFRFTLDDPTEASPGVAGPGGGHNIYAGLATDLHVELFANGVLVGVTEVSGTAAGRLLEIGSGDLGAGDYVFTLIATDAAGNIGFTADPFALAVSGGHDPAAANEAPLFEDAAVALMPTGWTSGWAIDL